MAINISAFKGVIHESILDAIYQTIDNIAPIWKTLPDNSKLKDLRKKLLPIAKEKLTNQLTTRIDASIPELSELVSFRFKRMSSFGTAEETRVELSSCFISEIVSTVIHTVKDLLRFDPTSTLENITSDFIRAEYDFRNIPPVREMTNIVMHELVHIVQHVRQLHRDTDEYRSYLAKNSDDFAMVMKKMLRGDELSSDEMRVYYASPQEIAAHAHNIASEALELCVDGSRPTAQHIQSAVDLQLGQHFLDRSNPHVVRVYNRYLKFVFKQITNMMEAS